MREQSSGQPASETHAYWAAERAREKRTIDRPYHELQGDSIMERRQVQIDNLRFRLDHPGEFNLTSRKIERMRDALSFQEAAQIRAVTPANN